MSSCRCPTSSSSWSRNRTTRPTPERPFPPRYGHLPAAAGSKIDPQPALDLLVEVAFERLGAAFGGDLAEAEHVDVARQFHHAPHVVVDEQDRHALGREEVDPLVDLLGDLRGKPDPRLVDQAEP